jgi:hypothetical protein
MTLALTRPALLHYSESYSQPIDFVSHIRLSLVIVEHILTLKVTCMQVRCAVYGLVNTSLGVECTLDRDLLTVGQCFQYHNRVYVIVSVVESQGRWCTNVVPENQHQRLRRPLPRRQDEAPHRELLEEWRQRMVQAERRGQLLQEEHAQLGGRLDRLMKMLEHLTKEPEAHQPEQSRPVQRRRGGEHVR